MEQLPAHHSNKQTEQTNICMFPGSFLIMSANDETIKISFTVDLNFQHCPQNVPTKYHSFCILAFIIDFVRFNIFVNISIFEN